MKISRTLSIVISIAAYVVATIIAIYTYYFFDDYQLIFRLAFADLAATVFIFLTSVVLNNSSMYDPYWSVKPVVIVLFYAWSFDAGSVSTLHNLFTLGIFLYGLRLTLNFYRGWPGLIHEDWRYANFRKQFPKIHWVISFLGIHLFPTIMVFLGCLPFIGAFSAVNPVTPWLAILGLIVLFGSVLLAFVADEQLRGFRVKKLNGMIDKGLWRYSRHPNYLGEILTWWGIFLFGLSFGNDFLWTGIGAVTITLMFVGISIPLIEKRLMTRRDWYGDYKKKVPMLLPLKFSKK